MNMHGFFADLISIFSNSRSLWLAHCTSSNRKHIGSPLQIAAMTFLMTNFNLFPVLFSFSLDVTSSSTFSRHLWSSLVRPKSISRMVWRLGIASVSILTSSGLSSFCSTLDTSRRVISSLVSNAEQYSAKAELNTAYGLAALLLYDSLSNFPLMKNPSSPSTWGRIVLASSVFPTPDSPRKIIVAGWALLDRDRDSKYVFSSMDSSALRPCSS
mmetsp:Transcript_30343/g.68431  ORF Transcript_30343/g.68431 Transcript_30343/m.68431 type:complete len:213 (-) Transcript_30343:63-701(-)